MCKRHLKHINVKCVKNNSRENIEWQNTCKHSTSIFWFPVEDIKIPQIFKKIQKVCKNVMSFNNHAQRSTQPYYLDVDHPFHGYFTQQVSDIVKLFIHTYIHIFLADQGKARGC